jgi:hypothetical protein
MAAWSSSEAGSRGGGASAAKLPALPDHVTLHIVDDQGLVLDARRQMLFSASPVDTLVLCCLVEGLTAAQMRQQLCLRLDLSASAADEYLAGAIAAWHAAGLFDSGIGGVAVAVRPVSAPVPAPQPAARTSVGPYRLLDTVFTIAFEDAAAAAALRSLARHLEGGRATSADPLRLVVGRCGDGYAVFADGRAHSCCARPDQAAAMALAAMVYFAAQRCGAHCALHAAAVHGGAGCILFPGEAGAGKSTLVAGFAAEGMEALCDDTAVLAGDSLALRPVRSGICVKDGSLPVLAARFPVLAGMPAYLRPDGRRARYLPCGRATARDGGDRHAVGYIVFPRYDPACTPAAESLGPADALKRLIKCLYLLDRRLEPETVERLIRWIGAIPSFAIRYPSLEAGVALVRHLVR